MYCGAQSFGSVEVGSSGDASDDTEELIGLVLMFGSVSRGIVGVLEVAESSLALRDGKPSPGSSAKADSPPSPEGRGLEVRE